MPTALNSNIPRGILLSNKPVVLWTHDPGAKHDHEAVVNLDIFPNFQDGQFLKIRCPQQQQQQQNSQNNNNTNKHDQQDIKKHDTHSNSQQSSTQQQQQQQQQSSHSEQFVSEDPNEHVNLQFDHVIVKGHAIDKETLAKQQQQQLQLSISKDIADRFNLKSRQEVYVELIEAHHVVLDHVELAFKEQYLGRSDMWRLQQHLKGTCVYHEKKIVFAGSIKATVKRLFAKDEQITSGYITDQTRMIFRSASAKYFLFIQMSREMWEFDEDGELYFEKAISNFLPQLFTRWKNEGTNHVVSIILFTRVFYETKNDDPLVNQSLDGRYYKDFYKVVADWETTDDWMSVIGTLKKEQLNFLPNVLLKSQDGGKVVSGQISLSYEGNVLEVINLALNPFDKHYVDRDLMRTGLSIILITPGVGKFAVNKKLLRLTNERMTENGIAMDLVCLSALPLHITPLMSYMDAPLTIEPETTPLISDTPVPRKGFPMNGNSPDKNAAHSSSNQKVNVVDPLYIDSNDAPTQKYYVVPHWIDCSFYHHETGRFIKQDKFKTRCKMHELQMMGIMEHDMRDISIPFLTSVDIEEQDDTIIQQKSSNSLNDKIQPVEENRESYSKSPNLSNTMRLEQSVQPVKSNFHNIQEKTMISYEDYDNNIFKTTSEPRFNKRIVSGPPPSSSKTIKPIHSSKNSFDGPDRPDTGSSSDLWQNVRHKSTTTWHHTGEQRRITSILSQSQQIGGKGLFDQYHSRKDDKNILDPFKASPTLDITTRHRPIRRGTINSSEGRYTSTNASSLLQPKQQQPQQIANPPNAEEDESIVATYSTVKPVPINSKGTGGCSDPNRKPLNHSPRQGLVSGSLPSIHKQSGNSEVMRTSLGAGNNRSSPSYSYGRYNTYKHLSINPCNPSDNQNLFTSHLRRWQHALPKAKDVDGPIVHWKSLVTPACLPLTTDYFPSNDELAQLYSHYMYTVSASEDTNLYQGGDRNLSEHKKTENLLIEMLSQRLAQGFQIIVDNIGGTYYPKTSLSKGENSFVSALGGGLVNISKDVGGKEIESGLFTGRGGSPSNNSSAAPVSNTIALTANSKLASTATNGTVINGKDSEKSKWKNMVWWLSMGHQVHQLTFDSSGQNVEVRRYVRTIGFDLQKISYKCVIWPKNMQTYRPKDITFNYPTLHYQWNYLDHLVAGYQDELTDNLRFWRTRFIVIPRESLPNNITFSAALHDHLDEEEKRIALFESWIQTIRKAKCLTPEEKEELQKRRKKEIGFSDLGIKLTTMDPSAFVTSDTMRAALTTPVAEVKSYAHLLSSINTGQTLTRDSKSKDFASALQDPKGGVKIMDRRWHFRMFHDVFTGTELVDWLINHIEDITTREQAVQFGNILMQRKPPLFHSATKRHNFLDGNYFYSLHEDFAVDKRKMSIFGRKHNNDSTSTSAAATPSKEKDNEPNLRQIPSTHSTTSFKPIEFQMSQSMIIDVDPYKKSDRRETAVLHYDTIHNPNNCYHFQLNWLGCTAQLVQELLQNWSRQAERCGLKLVEGSVDQAYEDSENNNPFQCPVPIPMAVPPPSVDELISLSNIDVPAQFYEIALVRQLGYVLDVEADVKFDCASIKGVELQYSYIKESFKYDQYIHRSGVSFVQIRPEGKGFYWVNNRLYTNHTPALIANRRQPSAQLWHPDTLRTKFQEHCSDGKWLTEFWETTRARFLSGLNPDSAWVFENSGTIVETEDTNQDLIAIKSPGTVTSDVSNNSSITATISTASSPKIDTNILSSSINNIHIGLNSLNEPAST